MQSFYSRRAGGGWEQVFFPLDEAELNAVSTRISAGASGLSQGSIQNSKIAIPSMGERSSTNLKRWEVAGSARLSAPEDQRLSTAFRQQIGRMDWFSEKLEFVPLRTCSR
jgi:hypothetical protein